MRLLVFGEPLTYSLNILIVPYMSLDFGKFNLTYVFYLIPLNWSLQCMGSPHSRVLVPHSKWPVSPVAGTENSLTIFCSSSPSYFCFTFPPLHQIGVWRRGGKWFKYSFLLPFVFHTLFSQFLILVKKETFTCFPKLMLYS